MPISSKNVKILRGPFLSRKTLILNKLDLFENLKISKKHRSTIISKCIKQMKAAQSPPIWRLFCIRSNSSNKRNNGQPS